MAPKAVSSRSDKTKTQIKKLSKLPKNTRVQKRPILRPTIVSPYAGANQQKVVYVSAKTPFISAVKRVRKLLSQAEKRSLGNVELINGRGNDRQKLQQLREKTAPPKGKEPEEVILKATNRAIENVLGLALFFQGQDDCRVLLRTGTVGVVDDLVISEDVVPEEGDEEEELPESRVRKIASVEVAISLKY